jgi:alkylated DNA repair dioxygenase AlkB
LEWSNEINRRVIQYGYKFNHVEQQIDVWDNTPKMPPFIQTVADRLLSEQHFKTLADQIIINEYLPGQGINAHTDKPQCFGATVASIR